MRTKHDNPFKPSFGSRPPILVGRDGIVDDVRLGIAEGPGSPLRAMAIVGPRGIGKTVLLDAMRDAAALEGWVAVATTASENMLADILEQTEHAIAHIKNKSSTRKITGITAAGFGLSSTMTEQQKPGWRVQMAALLEVLAKHGTGLLITVDEVRAGIAELEQFCKTLQHFITEQRDIAVVFAGLPAQFRQLASTPGLTFIWRAERQQLGSVPLEYVRTAFREIITAGHRKADTLVIEAMAQATGGYPFLIQLVGYHTWRQSDAVEISLKDVAEGVDIAKRRLGSSVAAYAVADLSPTDRTFLVKMAQDDGVSKVRDIAERMNVSLNYASVYRGRLLEAGVITAPRNGEVEFAIPYLRDYLREHAATLVWVDNE